MKINQKFEIYGGTDRLRHDDSKWGCSPQLTIFPVRFVYFLKCGHKNRNEKFFSFDDRYLNVEIVILTRIPLAKWSSYGFGDRRSLPLVKLHLLSTDENDR